MLTDFNNMSPDARVWVYQANRPFTAEEHATIEQMTGAFVREWTSHGNDLQGAFTIKENTFLILAVDEQFNQATGCSIDKSVHFISTLESTLDINLTDRSQIAFKKGNQIAYVPFNRVSDYIKEGEIGADTLVYNNSITKVDDLKKHWQIKAVDSWLNKYFQKTIS